MTRDRGKAFAERMWRARVLHQAAKLEAVMSERPPGARLGRRESDALENMMREAPVGVRFTLQPKPKPPVRLRVTDDIPVMARRYGVDTAIEIARQFDVHPDLWAVDVSDEFPDYSIHELYEETLSPPGSASAAG